MGKNQLKLIIYLIYHSQYCIVMDELHFLFITHVFLRILNKVQ
jgi:hypothetical protein